MGADVRLQQRPNSHILIWPMFHLSFIFCFICSCPRLSNTYFFFCLCFHEIQPIRWWNTSKDTASASGQADWVNYTLLTLGILINEGTCNKTYPYCLPTLNSYRQRQQQSYRKSHMTDILMLLIIN